MKQERFICLVSSFFLLGTTMQGCFQEQRVVNSPCATVNATMESKQNVDLSLMFGNDAIKTAVDAIAGKLVQKPNASTDELTSLGTDSAVRSAEANGKNLKTQDKKAMEKYLREEVIPTVKQNPTCNFVIAPPARPYVSIDRVALIGPEDQPLPWVWLKNTGQSEITCHLELRYMVDGRKYAGGATDISLVPNETRNASLRDSKKLPISDILSGKSILTFIIKVLYPLESENKSVTHEETWQFDPKVGDFFIARPK